MIFLLIVIPVSDAPESKMAYFQFKDICEYVYNLEARILVCDLESWTHVYNLELLTDTSICKNNIIPVVVFFLSNVDESIFFFPFNFYVMYQWTLYVLVLSCEEFLFVFLYSLLDKLSNLQSFRVSTMEALEFLEKFISMNPDSRYVW